MPNDTTQTNSTAAALDRVLADHDRARNDQSPAAFVRRAIEAQDAARNDTTAAGMLRRAVENNSDEPQPEA